VLVLWVLGFEAVSNAAEILGYLVVLEEFSLVLGCPGMVQFVGLPGFTGVFFEGGT
jgi:hypothetical protein